MPANEPTLLKCPTCGAPLDFDGAHSVIRCKYCGNNSVLPVGQNGASTSSLDEINQLINDQKISSAIERFSTLFGVDLDEANEAVQAIAGGRMATYSPAGSQTAQELIDSIQKIQHLLREGNRNGAISLYREKFDVSASRAEYAVDQIVAGSTHIQIPPAMERIPSINEQSSHPKKAGMIILISFITIFVFGMIGFFIFLGSAHHYYSSGGEVLIRSADGSVSSLAGTFFDPTADERLVGLVSVDSGKLLWKSSPLEENKADLVSGSDMLYAADGSHLKAFKLEDGSLVWQTEMSDKLAYNDSAILLDAGRVIVSTSDQQIAAYDAASGSLVWSRKESAPDDILRLMGDTLVIHDYLEGTYDDALYLLDPVTGSQKKVITPACDAGDQTYTLDSDTGIVYDAARKEVVLVFEDGCVQSYDLTSGQAQWTRLSDKSYSFAFYGFNPLLVGDTLFFGDEGNLVSVDLASRDLTSLVSTEGYSLVPLALNGQNLLVRAKDTQGSTRYEIWNVDVSSGSVIWKMNLKESAPIDPPDQMPGMIDKEDHGWTWHMTGDGFKLITFSGEPNEVTFASIDLSTGVSKTESTAPLKKVMGDFYSVPTIIGWQGDVVFMEVDGNLYSLDTASSKIKVIF